MKSLNIVSIMSMLDLYINYNFLYIFRKMIHFMVIMSNNKNHQLLFNSYLYIHHHLYYSHHHITHLYLRYHFHILFYSIQNRLEIIQIFRYHIVDIMNNQDQNILGSMRHIKHTTIDSIVLVINRKTLSLFSMYQNIHHLEQPNHHHITHHY